MHTLGRWDGYVHFFLCLKIDGVLCMTQLLYLWCKCHLLPIEQKAGQALASVWMHWRQQQSVLRDRMIPWLCGQQTSCFTDSDYTAVHNP